MRYSVHCGLTIFTPGLISLPKGGQPRRFGYWDGHDLSHYVIRAILGGYTTVDEVLRYT